MRRGLPADAAIGRAHHISAANQQALVNFSRADSAKTPPPCFFARRVRRRVREDPHRPEEEPRARGTPGVK